MEKKRIIIIISAIVTAVVVIVAALIIYSSVFRVVSTNPPNGGVHPIEGALVIDLSKEVTNFSEIERSFVVEPTVGYEADMVGKRLLFYPLVDVHAGEYTLSIPSIKHNKEEISDYILEFRLSNISEDDLNDRQKEAIRLAQTDIGDVTVHKYPFLDDIVTNQNNYTVDYRLDDLEELTILIQLHPSPEPPLSNRQAYINAYESARREALQYIKNAGVDSSDLNIMYEPQFMQNKYGTQVTREIHEQPPD